MFDGLLSEVNQQKSDAVDAFFTPEYLRDYTHASKTFRTNMYANAPKYKFSFHVYFDINQALKDVSGAPANYGLLVKSIELPTFSATTHDMNQYNRKRVVQTKINYNPVKVAFHDDNASEIIKLWHSYYTYYYKDGVQSESSNLYLSGTHVLNDKNIYERLSSYHDWGYVGDTTLTDYAMPTMVERPPKPSFFNCIRVFGFHQHNFIEYRLINPTIEQFSHDTYDFSQGNGVMEHTMTLKYETVQYFEGAINGSDPTKTVPKFGEKAVYDRTVSPIARPGANATIMGQGGLVDAGAGILDDLKSGNFIGAAQTAGTTIKTFSNPGTIAAAFKGDIKADMQGAANGTPNRNNIFSFPTPDLSSIFKL